MGTTYHRVAGLGAGGGRLVLGVGTDPGVGASGIDDEGVFTSTVRTKLTSPIYDGVTSNSQLVAGLPTPTVATYVT